MEQKLDMEHRMTAVEDRAKSNTRRIDKMEEEQAVISSLAQSIQVMANEQKHQTEAIDGVKGSVDKLEGKVDALEQKPAKRWDSLTEKAILTVAAALIGWALAQIGL